MLCLLISQGVNVNHNPFAGTSTGFTPLDAAEACGHLLVADIIRQAGGVRANENEPLRPLPPAVADAVRAAVEAVLKRGG